MNKKIIGLIIFVSLLCSFSLVLAAGIENPLGATKDFGTLLKNIAKEVGKLIITLGSIMIIIAGILYLTSAGSPEKIGTAKKALIYAIAGIAIGLAAEAITGIIGDIVK